MAFVGLRAEPAAAAPAERPQIVAEDVDDAVIGPSTSPAVSTSIADTVWIADWTFDAPGGGCTDAGWVKWDNRVLNVHDDSQFWHVDNRFHGQGGVISGRAATLSKHDLCWFQNGYGNSNDFSIILTYSGANATLAFDKASDSEIGFDFVTVEADSAGVSEVLGDPSVNPNRSPAFYRDQLLQTDGFDPGSHIALALPDYGAGIHEAYIRFASDGVYSDEDGLWPTALQAGLVVDNIVVTGGTAYSETFEGALNPNVTLIETANARPFFDAPWLRVRLPVTDNDPCQDNLTCAWLGSDPNLPAFDPSMGFGPGGAVVRNWLDDAVASPWVSLASTPLAPATVLRFRRFPGQRSDQLITQGFRVRSKVRIDNTDTPAPGDSIDCVSAWSGTSFNTLATFTWSTLTTDMTLRLAPSAAEIQVGFRTSDWQYLIGVGPPAVLNPGPGPYWDRVRIGRVVHTGPALDEGLAGPRSQAQDAFPTVLDPSIVGGEHYVPDGGNRFGTCAFSQGHGLQIPFGQPDQVITGDSICMTAVDTRGAGGISSVRLYGAITSGPHAGKAPGPYASVGGFFEVNAEMSRSQFGNIVANRWFVDLDDTYFRGGDVLQYFWAATDNQGGFASLPTGISALPISVAQAEIATGGLYEVNYLPVIDWDPAYLAAVVAHPTGDINPTPEQIAASSQRNCILYYQKTTSRRRSGPTQRTHFMYTLDELGYAGNYDVYDVMGYGDTGNQLGGRASVAQCSGYALIIQDDGRSNLTPNIPDREGGDANQVPQASWYRAYLAQGASSLAGTATFWSIGENTGFLHRNNPLFAVDFGLSGVVTNQGLAVSPIVRGKTTNTWASGAVTDFTGDEFTLNGGCPSIRAYDMANASGGATLTHRYVSGMSESTGGAMVMNRNAASKWNTVWMGFGWLDILFAGAPANPGPQELLATKVLDAVLPAPCQRDPNPTDGGGDPTLDAPPAVTALHPNVPNPFNPTTRIGYDLATAGRAQLRIYDVTGRLVRTLVDEVRAPGRYTATWTGLDAAGAKVASGVYFARLDATGFATTRKMVLLQ
jgi:hypothetical protein